MSIEKQHIKNFFLFLKDIEGHEIPLSTKLKYFYEALDEKDINTILHQGSYNLTRENMKYNLMRMEYVNKLVGNKYLSVYPFDLDGPGLALAHLNLPHRNRFASDTFTLWDNNRVHVYINRYGVYDINGINPQKFLWGSRNIDNDRRSGYFNVMLGREDIRGVEPMSVNDPSEKKIILKATTIYNYIKKIVIDGNDKKVYIDE